MAAIALGGGGAKGDFEIGAVRYLYDINQIPDIVTGTSVGAITALGLAHGGWDGLDLVLDNWLGLQKNADMYEEQRWFALLTQLAGDLGQRDLMRLPEPARRDLFQLGGGVIAASAGLAMTGPFGLMGGLIGAAVGLDALDDIRDRLETLFNLLENVRGFYDLTPTRIRIQNSLNEQRVRQSGIQLRILMVGLQDGELYDVDQNGAVRRRPRMLDRALRPQPASSPLAQVSLLDAVMASASAPMYFEPIRFPGNALPGAFVDGGIRETVPVRSALELGADLVYSIPSGRYDDSPSPTPLVPTGSSLPQQLQEIRDLPADAVFVLDQLTESRGFVPHDVLDAGVGEYAGRILSILASEIDRTDYAIEAGERVRVIRPRIDVHGFLTIDPGLIRIAMANGYMSAGDVVETTGQRNIRLRRRRQADAVILQRMEIWLEEVRFGMLSNSPVYIRHRPDEPGLARPIFDTLQRIRQLKTELCDLVQQRIDERWTVPSDIHLWWTDFEAHGPSSLPAPTWRGRNLWAAWGPNLAPATPPRLSPSVRAEPVALPRGPIDLMISCLDGTREVDGDVLVDGVRVGQTNRQIQGFQRPRRYPRLEVRLANNRRIPVYVTPS